MSSQYAPFRNTGPLCSEHHGGNCPDPNTCVYRIINNEAPWSDPFDSWIHAAEARGFKRGNAHAQHQFRTGIKLGFWGGVIATLAAMFLLALFQWAAAS